METNRLLLLHLNKNRDLRVLKLIRFMNGLTCSLDTYNLNNRNFFNVIFELHNIFL